MTKPEERRALSVTALVLGVIVVGLLAVMILNWGSVGPASALRQFQELTDATVVEYTAIEWISRYEARFDLLVDGELRTGRCTSGRFQPLECWLTFTD